MNTKHVTNKGCLVKSLEKFQIFGETKLKYQINDRLTVKPNIILDTIVHNEPHRRINRLVTLRQLLQMATQSLRRFVDYIISCVKVMLQKAPHYYLVYKYIYIYI
jgi:hypothetical protein